MSTNIVDWSYTVTLEATESFLHAMHDIDKDNVAAAGPLAASASNVTQGSPAVTIGKVTLVTHEM